MCKAYMCKYFESPAVLLVNVLNYSFLHFLAILFVGDPLCSSLCCLLLLSACCSIQWSEKYMDWFCHGKFWTRYSVCSLCYFYVLVYHHFNNNWLWWFACCVYTGEDIWYFLHAIQPGSYGIYYWEHDQFGCPWNQSNKEIREWQILSCCLDRNLKFTNVLLSSSWIDLICCFNFFHWVSQSFRNFNAQIVVLNFLD